MRRSRLFSGGAAKVIAWSLASVSGCLALAAATPSAAAAVASPSPAMAPVWPQAPKARSGAPNVLLILTDDVGFGATSTFGGLVPTPTFDALAASGLLYNRFHTTAMCSPTRASLLTGREPHRIGMGRITEYATGFPGYSSVIPPSAASVAKILKSSGYSTAAFGKWHLTPEWEMSQVGPFDRWPTGMGFEHFYGFLASDTSQWAPALVEDTTPIEPPHGDPNYIFERDMADHAINWIRQQRTLAPDKPFFAYYAPSAAHTPHHAPAEWLAKFRGQFDKGWDVVREETFARQKALAVIPPDTVLTPRPPGLPPWNSLSHEDKRFYARLMEAFAANLAFSDYQTGRVIEELRRTGALDNTLVIYIQGDNGASAEGGVKGTLYEQSLVTGVGEDAAYAKTRIADIGGPLLYNHYPSAWAWATSSPFEYFKQVGSHFGGTRNGMVLSWPAQIKEKGGLRSQFHHVADIVPTILDAAGVAAPAVVDGTPQMTLDGIDMTYTFDSSSAPGRRRTQVFELNENFAIYHDGWVAASIPTRNPWDRLPGGGLAASVPVNERTWALYNVAKDFSESRDLSREHPDKLKALQAMFWVEAERSQILPIHSRRVGTEGRPSLIAGRDTITYTGPLTRAPSDASPNTFGRSYTITADLVVPSSGGKGVLITQGGRFGGYGLYFHEGKPTFHYNAIGPRQFSVRGPNVLAPGPHKLVVEFVSDEVKPGSAGVATLLVDGVRVGSVRIDKTLARSIPMGDGLDIGRDTLTPVSEDYSVPHSQFNGEIKSITVRTNSGGEGAR